MISRLTAAAGLGALAAGVALLTHATVSDESQFFGRSVVGPPRPQQLALTFDDGPNPSATPRLLEVLARRGVRAAFFLIGEFVLREPALVREIAAAGHGVGNHTMHHRWLPKLPEATVRRELADCNKALEDALGHGVELFRAPHGARRPAVFRAARELGLEVVQWNLIVQDWEPVGAETILQKIERGMTRNQKRGRGTNVVLHDGGQSRLGEPRLPTVEAVRQLLERLPAETEFVVPPRWDSATIGE